jgi:hypothetical protein
MATVGFTSFLPEVLPLVPGCADIVALNAVRNAVIEFCTGSNYWQETQDAVTLSPSAFPLDIEAPSGAVPVTVLSLSVDGVPISPVSIEDLDATVSGWRDNTSDGTTGFYQLSPYQLALYPERETACEVVLRVSYAPSRTATVVEEYVFQKYLEELASGALARLLAQPGQAWSNPSLAEFHRGKFLRGVTQAAIEANRTFTRADRVVQARSIA